jgi:hypothetical protein
MEGFREGTEPGWIVGMTLGCKRKGWQVGTFDGILAGICEGSFVGTEIGSTLG